ncbi:unnamed protein product [Brassica rapa subsp. trilocularis]
MIRLSFSHVIQSTLMPATVMSISEYLPAPPSQGGYSVHC